MYVGNRNRRYSTRPRSQSRLTRFEFLETRLALSSFVVNTSDDTDDATCDAAHCSLREAIDAANTHPGVDVIDFDIAATAPTIEPASPLPAINDPVTLDGFSQSTGRVELNGSSAGLLADGIRINTNDSVIRGLVINRFDGAGIRIEGDRNVVAGNLIGTDGSGSVDLGNHGQGVFVAANSRTNRIGSDGDGIDDDLERNVISGNDSDGVHIEGGGSRQTVFFSDFGQGIPPEFSGPGSLASAAGLGQVGPEGNQFNNNLLRNTTSALVNDTTSASQPTVLRLTGLPEHSRLELNFLFAALDSWDTGSAGFDFFNVLIDGQLVFRENFGNGVTPGNTGQDYDPPPGVQLLSRPFTNLAGNDSPDSAWDLGRDPAFNSIQHSASTLTIQWYADGCCWSGGADESWAIDDVEVIVDSDETAGNVVSGNYIGTDVNGSAALGNGAHGISLASGAQGNRIGLSRATPGGRNILSGNSYSGVGVYGSATERNVIAGNFIGTDVSGSFAIGNQNYGVAVYDGAHSNWVGTNGDGRSDADEGNIIAGNLWSGVGISMVGSDRNQISGNRIGTDLSGSLAISNLGDGVSIFGGARSNQVGTNGDTVSDVDERNLISANNQSGVAVNDVGTSRNSIAGNWVGTDATGSTKLGNHAWGVFIGSGASDNLVGTNGDGVADVAERNVISGNAFCGIGITQDGTNRNVVAGNFIGTNLSGTAPLGNEQSGIEISHAAQENRVGTDGNEIADEAERNVISGNGGAGIAIASVGTQRNIVAGNYLGTNVTGQAAMGNATDGIVVFAGAQNNRIGSDANGRGDATERNVIAANLANGVAFYDTETTDNVVAGNLIGTNASGSQPLGNGNNGVSLVGGSRNRIGGDALAASNRIAFNNQAGVMAFSDTTENPIQRNSIYSNGGLGIDLLQSVGVTPNDPGDGDVGGNQLQNFPVLVSATAKRGKTTVRGSLQAAPRSQYRIELFRITTSDPTGFGEGESFIGSAVVSTKKKGTATFSVVIDGTLVPGQIVTATATSAAGDTSEFSTAISVTGKQTRVAAFLDRRTTAPDPRAVDVLLNTMARVRFTRRSILAGAIR